MIYWEKLMPLMLLLQLLSYGVFLWAAFIAVAFSAARFGGLFGAVGGHLLIAVLVTILDFRWISAEMSAPGWNGTPDMDFLFLPGVLIRVLLTNTLLLVVTVPALLLRRRQRTITVESNNAS